MDEVERAAKWAETEKFLNMILCKYGVSDPFGEKGGYWVLDDDYGWKKNLVVFGTWDLFFCGAITEISIHMKSEDVDWEVMISSGAPEEGCRGEADQGMGVLVSSSGIVDELVREKMPEPYRGLTVR